MGLFLLMGCTTANLRITKESSAAIPRSVSLKIGVAKGVDMPAEALDRFRSVLASTLTHRGFQVATDKPAGPFVNLSGTVTLYDPGSRVARWFGFAGGKLDSTWRVSDHKGAELSRARIDGGVTGGVYGGSIEDVFAEAAQRVADYLAGVRS